jgi:putative CocE/NonD family hydrolase
MPAALRSIHYKTATQLLVGLCLLALAGPSTTRGQVATTPPQQIAGTELRLTQNNSVTALESSVDRESSIRLRYHKRETMIPMRDGIRLHTTIYMPIDSTNTYPLLMKRTPYSSQPYGEDTFPSTLGPSDHFVDSGYIFVTQDVRGRYLSEGEFVQVTPHVSQKSSPGDIDESTDTYDTIEWLLANIKNHNGRVGMYGISYPGFYCSAGMIDAHPALKAVSPQAPVADWYFDDFLHNGAFFLAHAYRWLGNNALERAGPTTQRPPPVLLPSADGYQFFLEAGTIQEINHRFLKGRIPFWEEMMAHPNRDEFWEKRNILPHLENVAPAVMLVTGWFDAEDLYGSFKTYQSIEQLNPGIENVLVVGPWRHGGWASEDGDRLGDIHFGSKTAAFYRAEIEFPFFERHLKDGNYPPLAEATVFETGSNRWRIFDQWPPALAFDQRLYFGPQGTLVVSPNSNDDLELSFDEYISDPAKPVPFTQSITPRMNVEYMLEDQRFAGRRPDVLTYQTAIFDNDLTVAGSIDVELWVSTSGTDADFIVKLIDVFPDGTDPAILPNYQMKVRSEVMRARYRESFDTPKPLPPGEPTCIRFELQDVLHCFQKGHRLMVQVQSTWFPLVDRNPQKFVPNIFYANKEDFTTATHRILRSAQYPSHISFRSISKCSP